MSDYIRSKKWLGSVVGSKTDQRVTGFVDPKYIKDAVPGDSTVSPSDILRAVEKQVKSRGYKHLKINEW